MITRILPRSVNVKIMNGCLLIFNGMTIAGIHRALIKVV